MKEIVTDEIKAKLYELFEQHDKIVEEQDEYIEQLRERNKHIQSENTRLKAERDKAVEDMKSIVDNVREEHCDETCCFACKFDCDTSITDSGSHACECPGFERDDCFEWRGLEE